MARQGDWKRDLREEVLCKYGYVQITCLFQERSFCTASVDDMCITVLEEGTGRRQCGKGRSGFGGS